MPKDGHKKEHIATEALKKSEERYKAFIAQSTEGIWRFELEKQISIKSSFKKQIDHFYTYGYLAECNDAMAHMYGFTTSQDIIGARLSDLLIRTDKNNTLYLTEFIRSQYKLSEYESHEKDKDGNFHIFQNNLTGIVEDGMLKRAWGTQRDITKQKRAEQQQLFLEKASNMLVISLDQQFTLQQIAKLLVPYLADYCRIAITGEDNKIKEITVSHSDPTQVTLVEALFDSYKNIPNITHGVPKILQSGKSEMIPKIDDNVLKKFKTSKQLVTFVKKIGLKSYMGVPLIARGKTIGAITFSSIQDHRYYTKEDLQFTEELARRIALTIDNVRLFKEAQEAITLRDDFISVASHELKTPVTSVKIFTQVLQKHADENGDKKASLSLEKMDKQINKLTELIYNLLNIAKIQTGRLEFNEKVFDFDQMVHEAVDVMQHMTTKHTLQLQGITNKKIRGDEDRIGQVLSNLISNAIKYSPTSDKVIITLTTKKDSIGVSVQDFGIGMDREHLDKIFHRFYRVSSNTDKTFPGLGIGLYISNEIIKRHNGRLWAESKTGYGSTFYFTMPINQGEK